MANCYEMKSGDVYTCERCGFEVQVVKQGEDLGLSDDPNCMLNDGFSSMNCCGLPLAKKSA